MSLTHLYLASASPRRHELLLQIRENRPYVSLEPASTGGYVISTAAPLPVRRTRKPD